MCERSLYTCMHGEEEGRTTLKQSCRYTLTINSYTAFLYIVLCKVNSNSLTADIITTLHFVCANFSFTVKRIVFYIISYLITSTVYEGLN